MTTFDFDDYHEANNRLDLLNKIKEACPHFRCTVFAVPGLGSKEFWDSTPDWIELAVHGWLHPHPRESEHWTYSQMDHYMSLVPSERFVKGFKAPGWQISDGSYEWLLERNWWVADQDYNDERRPKGLKVYKVAGNWHGHIQNDCGNGLEETFDEVLRRATFSSGFSFVSEVVQ